MKSKVPLLIMAVLGIAFESEIKIRGAHHHHTTEIHKGGIRREVMKGKCKWWVFSIEMMSIDGREAV